MTERRAAITMGGAGPRWTAETDDEERLERR